MRSADGQAGADLLAHQRFSEGRADGPTPVRAEEQVRGGALPSRDETMALGVRRLRLGIAIFVLVFVVWGG